MALAPDKHSLTQVDQLYNIISNEDSDDIEIVKVINWNSVDDMHLYENKNNNLGEDNSTHIVENVTIKEMKERFPDMSNNYDSDEEFITRHIIEIENFENNFMTPIKDISNLLPTTHHDENIDLHASSISSGSNKRSISSSNDDYDYSQSSNSNLQPILFKSQQLLNPFQENRVESSFSEFKRSEREKNRDQIFMDMFASKDV